MKIVIWGTGQVAREFKDKLVKGEIIAYIDSFPKDNFFDKKPVYTVKEFLAKSLMYDYIVVANAYTNEVFHICVSEQIPLNRLIFLRPLQNTDEVEKIKRNIVCLEELAPDYVTEALKESDKRMGIDIKGGQALDCNPVYYYDYFRYRTFELIADQILDLEGDIAEVGVYKGQFARIINQKFPSDKFYLFDTFEGFEEKEAKKELESGNCHVEFIKRFKETSVEQVLSLLAFPENCIVRKGLFPKTTEGIDTSFKFVSIDVDFEDSIYASIEYFYPRLIKNGFIFIHDYNEQMLKGVKKAVARYEEKHGAMIKIPIADKCGTLIITK